MRNPGPRWFLVVLAVALNLLPLARLGSSSSTSQTFALPDSVSPGSSLPFFQEEFINPDAPQPMAHVSSICELPDGKLAATWYAGSREGAPDVAIFFATSEPRQHAWSNPRTIVTPETAARDSGRAVRKVGNALIFSDRAGKLWLVYVTITIGGWSGSSLNLASSSDQGQSWTPGRRLTLSPFFNLSELVKNGPVRLSGSGWAVPIYHELVGKFPELLWLDHAGESKSRIAGGSAGFQPALVALSTNDALAFLRDTTSRRRISMAHSHDAGRSWSAPEVIDFPNPDSGLDAVRLADGRLLLAFNDSASGRENLRLALSTDNARTWRRVATIAQQAGAEFSYPFLLQTRDGNIHLVYTWKRKAIKHAVFNPAWLAAGGAS